MLSVLKTWKHAALRPLLGQAVITVEEHGSERFWSSPRPPSPWMSVITLNQGICFPINWDKTFYGCTVSNLKPKG